MDDGGPAFPIKGLANDEDADSRFHGMSLRDWFAGMALCGSLADDSTTSPAKEAGWAYDYADAMIVERTKETPDSDPKKPLDGRAAGL